MTFAAYFACALLLIIIGQWYALVRALDRADAAERHLRWLHSQADELRADYGAEIARSKRMAMRLVERAQ